MKKLLLTTITAAAVMLAACSEDPKVLATGVTIEPTLTLEVGAVRTLTATVQPTDATNQTVNYVSSATGVAMVNGDKLTAVAVGEATITAITEDGSHTAECKVTVIPVPVPATGVSLNHETFVLGTGKTLQLEAILEPVGATTELLWGSSDNAIAIVTPTGLVTARAIGEATITVTTIEGGYTATCDITVEKNVVPVESLDIFPSAASSERILAPGSLLVINCQIVPATADDQHIIIENSDPSVATVSDPYETVFYNPGVQDVMVTALKEGSTTITFTVGGVVATKTITVTDPSGDFLGIVSPRTDKTWIVGNQEWTDVINASGCDKETFDGGNNQSPVFSSKIDCAKNKAPYSNTLYSWGLVNVFKDRLCSGNWRVPTEEDFCMLDKTLNNRSDCIGRTSDNASVSNYFGEKWGGEPTGVVYTSNQTSNGYYQYQGSHGFYWSSTPLSSLVTANLFLGTANGAVYTKYTMSPVTDGLSVRCVRDVQ